MGKSNELFLQMREDEAMQGIGFEHLLDAKKSNINTAVTIITQTVKDGNYDSLKGLVLALKGKELFSELEKQLRPLAEDNYLNKIGKNYQLHDTSIDEAATKTDYDFSVCQDPVYNELEQQSIELKEKLDERKKFLKTVTKSMTIVNDETGEISTIYPPNKLQKMGLKVSLK